MSKNFFGIAPKSPKGDLFSPPSGGMGGEPLNHIRLSLSGLSYNNEVYQADMQLYPFSIGLQSAD